MIQNAWGIAKGVGWENVPRRVRQSLVARSGLLDRAMDPRHYVTDHLEAHCRSDTEVCRAWDERAKRFLSLPDPEQLHALVPASIWDREVTDVCRRALAGEYRFFSRWYQNLGWPPNFNHDPVNQIDWPVGPLWPKNTRSGPPRNDIKLVWEPSRFTLGYYFARAYRYTGEERWAEAFWEMFDAWVAQNPVNQTVAWGCGQEIAFRLMAMLTGAFATLASPVATPGRLRRLETLCWQFGKRIALNINYALSQKNNHGLSEAAGLWTIGLVFPEFPESARWRRKGMRFLQREVQRQIYVDGSYVQNSLAYHRVMLDDLLWVICLARRNASPLAPSIINHFRKATEWLGELVDVDTGRVPNVGPNDGANVLPLSCSDYLDYRPTWEAAATVSSTPTRLAKTGSWSEKTLWLTGQLPSFPAPPSKRASSWTSPIGGYHVLRGPNSYAMLRAVTYRDRPGQCDMLHLDLWYRGLNVLRDAGSFRYYHEDPGVKAYFGSAESHNTLTVDERPQMRRGPNFLWFDWPQGKARFLGETELDAEATYGRRPHNWLHRRKVARNEDSYLIADSYAGGSSFTIRWRLTPELVWRAVGDGTYEAHHEQFSVTLQIQVAGDHSFRLTEGWESLYYGERQVLPVVEVRGRATMITTSVEFFPLSASGPVRTLHGQPAGN